MTHPGAMTRRRIVTVPRDKVPVPPLTRHGATGTVIDVGGGLCPHPCWVGAGRDMA